MNDVLEWKHVASRVGPAVTYGYWNEAKVFSIFYDGMQHHKGNQPRYVVKSMLPGFRPDLPNQVSETEARAFAERMLHRWVAKRGLLFKQNIVVTDAMIAAARDAANRHTISDETLNAIINAALKAREPHAASHANKNNSVRA